LTELIACVPRGFGSSACLDEFALIGMCGRRGICIEDIAVDALHCDGWPHAGTSERRPLTVVARAERPEPDLQLEPGGLVEVAVAEECAGGGQFPDVAQLQQAARWFFGPARDPATLRGWRARAMAASAFGSAAEWLACAVTPALLVVLVAVGSEPVRSAAGTFIAICCTQVVVTEARLGAPAQLRARLTRLIAFPLACTVHGVGGIVGAASLLAGGSGTGKTERSGARR
jgi:hypothetical protein